MLSEILIISSAASRTVTFEPSGRSWRTPVGRLFTSAVIVSSSVHVREPAAIASATAPSTYSLNTDAIGPGSSASRASPAVHVEPSTVDAATRRLPIAWSCSNASSTDAGGSSIDTSLGSTNRPAISSSSFTVRLMMRGAPSAPETSATRPSEPWGVTSLSVYGPFVRSEMVIEMNWSNGTASRNACANRIS